MDKPQPQSVESADPPQPRHTIEQDAVAYADDDRAGAGGSVDTSPGDPGGTLGTGGSREQDQ